MIFHKDAKNYIEEKAVSSVNGSGNPGFQYERGKEGGWGEVLTLHKTPLQMDQGSQHKS